MGAGEENVPVRLIICVDGAQYNPSSGDEPTNIHRIYSSIPVGKCTDSTSGGVFKQEVKYVPGLGATDNLLNQGVTKQIQDVYEACSRLPSERDEVWLFGFGRGAYVVRAVAGLLHNFGAVAPGGSSEYPREFRKVLKDAEAQARTSDSLTPTTTTSSSFRTKPAPRIQFLGAFDTVSDSATLDISLNRSTFHMRHAVALHEDRKALKPDYIYPEELYGTSLPELGRSFVQAHFVGSHADMGGSAKRYGLALYPVQWMLLEARQCGLAFNLPTDATDLKSPLSVVLPKRKAGKKGQSNQGQSDQIWTFTAENKIVTRMQDLRDVHGLARNHEKNFAIKLVSSRLGSIRQKQSRDPFTREGLLRGYCDWSPQGTIIHPSVYLLIDEHINIALETKELKMQRQVEDWRRRMLGVQDGHVPDDLWGNGDDEDLANPGAIRVLVCGNTGVGKSTLINRTFGVDVTYSSHRTRGIHDVREEMRWEGRPDLIIHDSGGFEAGADDEFQAIEGFLKERSESDDVLARVHVVWFCVDINSARTLQTATEKLFKTCSLYAKDVPIVVVATKKDDFLDIEFGTRRRELKKLGQKVNEDECEQYAEERLQERIETIRAEMESVPGGRLDACLAVAQDDNASIANLSKITSHCFNTDKLRLLYIRAQVTRVDLKVELALAEIMRRYRRLIRRSGFSLAFSGATIQRKVSTHLVVKAVINCFGLPSVSSDVAVDALKANAWRHWGSNVQLALAESFNFIGIAGAVVTAGIAPVWLLTGGINMTYILPTTCRMFLIMACDLTLVLARSFKEVTFRASGQPNELDVAAAAKNYAVRGYSQHVHRDLQRLLPRRNPTACIKMDNIQRGVEDIFTMYKDKLMEDVDLPLDFAGVKIGSDVEDDTSTDGDSTLMNDIKETRAALAEMEANADSKTGTATDTKGPAVPELEASQTAAELPAESKVFELDGTSSTTSRAELA